MKTLKWIISFQVIFLIGCLTDNDENNPKSLVNNKYTDDVAGISLQFPQNWTSELNYKFGNETVDVVGRALPVNNFAPNVNVITNLHSGSRDLNVVIQMFKQQLKTQLPGVVFLSDTVYVKGKATFGELFFTVNIGGNELKYNQTLFINRERDIQITYTDKLDHFDGNTEFTQVKNSLTVF